MWVISIEAFPDKKKNPEVAKEFGGAFVNCWVDFLLEDGAIELAKFYVKNEGWNFLRFEEENVWLDKEDCINSEDRRYFLEAEENGICMVWYSYPLEAETEDEDFDFENSTTNNQKTKRTEH